MRRRVKPGTAGQALIVALILLMVAAIMVLGAIFFHQQSGRHYLRHAQIVQERYMAEAGLQMTLQKLNSDEHFSQEIQNLRSGQRNPFDTTAAPGTISWESGTIRVVIEPAD